eukprot:221635-Hanusia_phi.AAC.1
MEIMSMMTKTMICHIRWVHRNEDNWKDPNQVCNVTSQYHHHISSSSLIPIAFLISPATSSNPLTTIRTFSPPH